MTDLLDLLLEPQVLVKLHHTSGIRDGKGALYPTMLDPSDTSRNFERFGSVGHIYWLEFACAGEGGVLEPRCRPPPAACGYTTR